MRVVSSAWLWAALLLLGCPVAAHAEFQLKPAISGNFGQKTTFVADPTKGYAKVGFGLTGLLIGSVLGVEADFGRRSDIVRGVNVLGSSVTTLTGNVTLAMPKRLVEYTLRPYFVGGAGLMFVRVDQTANTLDLSMAMNAVDLGGGVTGFLTPRIGLNWDVRHFRNFGEDSAVAGVCVGPCELSFWRVNMALAIRY